MPSRYCGRPSLILIRDVAVLTPGPCCSSGSEHGSRRRYLGKVATFALMTGDPCIASCVRASASTSPLRRSLCWVG